VRLAGLYGPGRIVGMTTLLHGQGVGGDPEDLLNLIHVEDAAALLQAVAAADSSASIELGADGVPLRRRDYYEHLAMRLGVPCRFGRGEDTVGFARRRSGSRACCIDPTCARTGWRPRHRDARLALDQLLAARQ
jgi:nucleoside-diphosphate-sugar epimerase